MQSLHLGKWNVCPCRVVRIGQINDFRPVADISQDRVDTRSLVRLLGHDSDTTRRPNADRVFQEPVLAVQALVLRAQKRIGQQRQDLIRPIAADYPRRIKPMSPRNGLAQRGGGPVRILREGVSARGNRSNGLRRRAERRLVRRQLVNHRHARDPALSGHVSLD